MEKDLKLLDKIFSLENEVLDYLEETDNWIFYWIDNKEVHRFIEAYPEDYANMVYLRVVNLSAAPLVRIIFDEHPDGISSIERCVVLKTFREVTKYRWDMWNGKVDKILLEQKAKELSFHEKRASDLKREIAEIEKSGNSTN